MTLIGRDTELARLAELLEGEAWLVTVVGPPGVGKSALARALRERQGVRAPRTALIDLSLVAPGRLGFALGRAVAAPIPGVESEVVHQLGRALASLGQVCWVLDNAEHLAVEVALTLVRLHEDAPSARFLVTSQHALGLRDETLQELAPLAVPSGPFDVDRWRRAPSVQLLEVCVRRQHPDFTLGGAADVEAAGRLVAQLDGLPLAIELAAGRRTEGGRIADLAVAPDEATLRRTLDWSFAMLTEDERRLLRRCSWFHGSFTVDAAEAVGDCEGAVDTLQTLRRKSLVHRRGDELELLGVVRTYARGACGSTERAEVAGLQARHFVALARTSTPRTPSPGWVASHVDDLQQALRVMLAEGDADAAGELALLLDRAFRRSGAVAEQTSVLDEVLACRMPASSVVRGRVLLARVQTRVGARPTIEAWLEEGTAIARRHGAAALEGWFRVSEGGLAYERGDRRAARAHFDAALELARSARDPELESHVRTEIARLFVRYDGRLDHAILLLEEARSLARRADAPRREGWAEGAIASVLHAQRRLEDAAEAYDTAATMMAEAGEDRFRAWMVGQRGVVLQELERFDEAQSAFVAALELARPFADRWLAVLEAHHVFLAHERGDSIEVLRERYEAVVGGLERVGLATVLGPVLDGWAAAEAAAGERRRAEQVFARALATIDVDAHDQRAAHDVHVGHLTIAWDGADPSAALDAHLSGVDPEMMASEDVRFAIRMLRRRLGSLPREGLSPRLRVDTAVRGFTLGGGPLVDLRRFRAQRRLLGALVDASKTARHLSVEELQRAGWPDERCVRRSGAARVYVALHALRDKGLRTHLRRSRDGWWLSAEIETADLFGAAFFDERSI